MGISCTHGTLSLLFLRKGYSLILCKDFFFIRVRPHTLCVCVLSSPESRQRASDNHSDANETIPDIFFLCVKGFGYTHDANSKLREEQDQCPDMLFLCDGFWAYP